MSKCFYVQQNTTPSSSCQTSTQPCKQVADNTRSAPRSRGLLFSFSVSLLGQRQIQQVTGLHAPQIFTMADILSSVDYVDVTVYSWTRVNFSYYRRFIGSFDVTLAAQ